MTTYPETETVARILARGYNRHTQDHGPDGSAAGEVTQTADGHGLLVVRDGAEYAVRVSGAKPFEVRRDDRGFQRGDRVRLVAGERELRDLLVVVDEHAVPDVVVAVDGLPSAPANGFADGEPVRLEALVITGAV